MSRILFTDRKPTHNDLPIVTYSAKGITDLYVAAVPHHSYLISWEPVTLSDPDDIAPPPTPHPKFNVGDQVQAVGGDDVDYVHIITGYHWDDQIGVWRYHAGTGYSVIEPYLRPADPDPDARYLREVVALYPGDCYRDQFNAIADRLDAMRPGLG